MGERKHDDCGKSREGKYRLLAAMAVIAMVLAVSVVAVDQSSGAENDVTVTATWDSGTSTLTLNADTTGPMPNFTDATKGNRTWLRSQDTTIDYQSLAAKVVFGDKLTTIGGYALYGFTNVTEVQISASAVSVGDNAFGNMGKLAKFTVDPENTRIIVNNDSLYTASAGLPDILLRYPPAKAGTSFALPSSVSEVGDYALSENKNLESVSLGVNLLTIGDYAFDGALKVRSLSIPASVSDIGDCAFRGMKALVSISVDPSNTGYYSESGVLFERSGSNPYDTLLLYPISNPGLVKTPKHYYDTTAEKSAYTQIGGCPSPRLLDYYDSQGARHNDSQAIVVYVVPYNTVKIAAYAFQGALITDVIITQDVTTIGAYAFQNCERLTSISIPTTVGSVGAHAFENCYTLIAAQVPGINLSAYQFAGCNRLSVIMVSTGGSSGDTISFGTGALPTNGINSSTGLVVNKNWRQWNDTAWGGASEISSMTKGKVYYRQAQNNYEMDDLGGHNKIEYPFKNYKSESITITTFDWSGSATKNSHILRSTTNPDKTTDVPLAFVTSGAWTHKNTGYARTVLLAEGVDDITNAGSRDLCVPRCCSPVVAFPSTVTKISSTDGLRAWSFFHTIEVIPKTLTSINGGAYPENANLQSFIIDPENPKFTAIDGILFDKTDGKMKIIGSSNPGHTIVIDQSITDIGGNAFRDSRVHSATFPETEIVGETGGAFWEQSLPYIYLHKLKNTKGDRLFWCESHFGDEPAIVELGNETTWQGSTSSSTDNNFLVAGIYLFDISGLNSDQFKYMYLNKNNEEVNNRYINLATGSGVTKNMSLAAGNAYVYSDYYNSMTVYNTDGTTATKGSLTPASKVYYFQIDDVLIFYGTGTIPSVSSTDNAKWKSLLESDTVKHLYFTEGITGIGDYAFRTTKSNIESVSLPSTVTTIGAHAFDGCAITNQYIPNAVNSINATAFQNCNQLERLVCYGNSTYTTVDGVLYKGNEAIVIPAGKESISIRSGTSTIAANAGYGATMKYLSLPSSLRTIGEKAFYDSENLESVTFSSASLNVGASAFQNSAGILSLKITAGSTTLGANAFDGCANLAEINISHASSVTFGNSSIPVPEGGKYYKNGITEVTVSTTDYSKLVVGCFYTTVASNYKSCSEDGSVLYLATSSKLTIVASGEGTGRMTNFPRGAAPWHKYYASISEITITPGVKHIGNYAFQDLNAITSILLPSDLESIGDYAFSKSAITSIEIPDSVVSIGTGAFSDCADLTSADIGSSVETIGEKAFYSSGLQSVVLSQSVTSIAKDAFTTSAAASPLAKVVFMGATNVTSGAFTSTWYLDGATKYDAISGTVTAGSFYTKEASAGADFDGSGTNAKQTYIYDTTSGMLILKSKASTEVSFTGTVPSQWSGAKTLILVGITKVSGTAFSGLSNLETVSSTTLQEISRNSAFSSTLKTVEAPALTKISAKAFEGCTSLTSISMSKDATQIVANAFNTGGASITVTAGGENLGTISSGQVPIFNATLYSSVTQDTAVLLDDLTVSSPTNSAVVSLDLAGHLLTYTGTGSPFGAASISLSDSGRDAKWEFTCTGSTWAKRTTGDVHAFTEGAAILAGGKVYDDQYSQASVYFDLSKATITPSPIEYTYDGTAKTPTITVKFADSELDSTLYTVSYTDNINAGNAKVRATLVKSAEYYKDQEFTIKKKVIGLPDAVEKDYNGSLQTSGILATDDYTVAQDNGGTNVGQYDVMLTLKDAANHKWADVQTDHKTFKGLIINKGTPTTATTSYKVVYSGSVSNPAKTDIVYTGFNGQRPADSKVTITGTATDVSEHAQATVTISGDANFKDAVLMVEYEILKADSSWSAAPVAASGLVYTGSELTIYTPGNNIGGTPKYTVVYTPNSGSAGKGTAADNKGVNAGSYKVTYEILADDNYNALAPKDFTVVIGQAESTITVQAKNMIFTGEEQELIKVTAATGGDPQYKAAGSTQTDYGDDIPRATAVGNYTVYYKVDGTNNYKAIAESTVQSIINSGTSAITVSANKLTYDGTAQALITLVEVVGGTPKYSTDGTVWGDDIPMETNAKTYTVHYKVDGGTQYSGTDPQTIEVTIDKAQAAWTTVPVAGTLTYNGSAQGLISNVPAVSAGTPKYKVDEGTYQTTLPAMTDANTYTLYYMIDGDDNYLGVDAQQTTVTISKATVKSVSLSSYAPTYTGSSRIPTADDLTFQYTTTVAGVPTGVTISGGEDAGITAGNHSVTVTIPGTGNFNAATFPVPYTISKAPSVWKTYPVAAKALTYTGSPLDLIETDGASDHGSVQYRIGTDISSGIPKETDADTYTVYYMIRGDPNHEDSAESSLKVTISQATPVLKIRAATIIYDGDPHDLVSVTSHTGGTAKFSTDGISWSTTIPQKTDAGTYTVHYKVEGDKNYTDLAEQKVSVTITEATVKTSVTMSYLAADGTPQDLLEVVATGATVKYFNDHSPSQPEPVYSKDDTRWSTDSPKEADADTYTVYYAVIVGESATVYSQTLTVYDESTDIPDITITAYVLVYNGEEQLLVTGASTTPGVTLQYSTDGTTFSESEPTVKNVGADPKKPIYYRVYNGETSQFQQVIVAEIAPAIPTVTATPRSLTYDGTQQQLVDISFDAAALEFCIKDTEPGPSDVWTTWTADTSVPKKTDAGTYKVWYRTADTNYRTMVSSIDVTISQAQASWETLPAAIADLKYTGGDMDIFTPGTPIGGDAKGEAKYEVVYQGTGGSGATGALKGHDAGTYIVKYSILGNDNYLALGEQTLTVEIAKATPVLTVTGKSGLKYDGTAKVLIDEHTAVPADAVILFSLDGENYSSELPKGTNATTYTVSYKVDASKNFNAVSPKTVQVTIGASEVTIQAPTPIEGLSFTGQPLKLVKEGQGQHGHFTYSLTDAEGSYAQRIPTGTNAATYTVYWKFNADDGYVSQSGLVGGIQIGKSTPTITVVITDVPEGTMISPKVEGNIGKGEVMYEYSDDPEGDYSEEPPTAIGTYYVKATVAATENTNEAFSEPAEFKIVFNGKYFIKSEVVEGDGTITGSMFVMAGEEGVFEIRAAPGNIVSDVLVDDVSVGVTGKYTFASVTSEHTIKVRFESCPGAETYEDSEGNIVEKRSGSTSSGWTAEVERISYKDNTNTTTATITREGMYIHVRETVTPGLEPATYSMATLDVEPNSTVSSEYIISVVTAARDASVLAGITSIDPTLILNATTESGSADLNVRLDIGVASIGGLYVRGDLGSMRFDEQCIDSITGSSSVLKIGVSKAFVDKKTSELIEGAQVYDVTVTAGSSEVKTFKGMLRLSLPYTPAEGESTTGLGIYYLSPKGVVERIGGSYVSGFVSVDLPHLSQYFVGKNKYEPEPDEPTYYDDEDEIIDLIWRMRHSSSPGSTGGTSLTLVAAVAAGAVAVMALTVFSMMILRRD